MILPLSLEITTVILEIIGIVQLFQANTFLFVSLGIFQSNITCMKLLTTTCAYSSGSYSFLQVSELRARRLYFTFVNRTLLGEENVAAASDRFEIIIFEIISRAIYTTCRHCTNSFLPFLLHMCVCTLQFDTTMYSYYIIQLKNISNQTSDFY